MPDRARPDAASLLLGPWVDSESGVGLPPFDVLEPSALGEAIGAALAERTRVLESIENSSESPTFANTLEPLEASAQPVARLANLLNHVASTAASDDIRALQQEVAPQLSGLEDEVAARNSLVARIEHVVEHEPLTSEQRRLSEVVLEGLRRRGAGLPESSRGQLREIHSKLAQLQAQFVQNLMAEQEELVLWIEDESALVGLPSGQREAMASLAERRGRAGQWALAIQRPMVWPFLTRSADRDLRERAWKLWMGRGANEGQYDNRPIMAEILRLRGEKARMLGAPSYAELVMSRRMASCPETVKDLLEEVWDRVRAVTQHQLAELQELASADGVVGELEAWDRLYYAERLRQTRFGLDADAVRPYLALESVKSSLFSSAERLFGVRFERLDGVATIHPDIEVYLATREAEPIGVLWLDLFQRNGKSVGSWQAQLQARARFPEATLAHTTIQSSLPQPADGEPVVLSWELANVLFHEFGHALHMLLCRSSYPSLGSLEVEWDFIELPALLNERWLSDRDLLERHARHVDTGQPIPDTLLDALDKGRRYDRIFSLTLDYLAGAVTDLRLHMLADGSTIDAMAVEDEVLAELDMPRAIEPLLRISHAVHTFSEAYAAGLYSYLWSDVLASEVAGLFEQAEDGLWDAAVADRYRQEILERGSSASAAEQFRALVGREPSPESLLARFGL